MKKIKHLYTKEGQSLSGEEYNVYPRPQLKRDSFYSLNGKWRLTYGAGEQINITVPYPPESILSGVFKDMGKDPSLVYEREFTLPKSFKRDRVILNFGAVDQVCAVFVNNVYVGKNEGGYNHFSFDITNCLQEVNTVTVKVKDSLSSKEYPYGKQTYRRGGMWYTPVSGIWQSVWLESVPYEYVKEMRIQTGKSGAKIIFVGAQEGRVTVTTPNGKRKFPVEGGICNIELDSVRNWSPADPYLYCFTAEMGQDKIESYFAIRTLEIKTVEGFPRLCLNGEPYFFHAVLDQGYFSDGIFTPATPDLYRQDILKMKELGFNTLRKHIKVEPDWFYYECDRLGMIVFQDFVNNGSYSFLRDTAFPTVFSKKLPDLFMGRSKKQKKQFIEGMKKTVNQLYNHPCVCYWTIFNEGWGQFESDGMYELLRELDSTRFIDSTSGWFKKKKSDVESLHIYFKPVKVKESDKPIVLSEFGGYSYKVENHVANE
ncbi:MAG: glycoside hydrolase family 2, partial [Clostridia bacterium]|nr:glycoside hydrolase family 2 [Clostridia bacterium]